jgi:quercetin dioxygenase-like cupin family protein
MPVPKLIMDCRGLLRKEDLMTRVGETMGPPLLGHEFRCFADRFRILESSRGTNDGSLRVDYFAAPRAKVPEHVHHYQEERFEVVSGWLCLRVGGQEMTLGSGQIAVGPPGVPHAWWNPSDEEEARFLVRLRPGLGVEVMLERVLDLAREGKTVGGMFPSNPLRLAVLLYEIWGWVYLTGVPRPMRKALFAPVALLAFASRGLGYG